MEEKLDDVTYDELLTSLNNIKRAIGFTEKVGADYLNNKTEQKFIEKITKESDNQYYMIN